LKSSPYSCPVVSSDLGGGSKLPSCVTTPSEFLDERFVVERPFDILRLARTASKSVVWPSEGIHVGQTRLSSWLLSMS